MSDEEFLRLTQEFGIKKEYNYGKAWYGEAIVFLLNGNNGAIFRNDNGFRSIIRTQVKHSTEPKDSHNTDTA